ncbi:MAG: ABC transporter substrate-binding protein [Tissierellia bacterium]|nr:ABC transporter substrate-binding protein [Tissierellia bacterium]
MKKITKILIGLMLISVFISGCSNTDKDVSKDPGQSNESSSETSGEVKYKKEIIIAIADEFTTIDPMETTAESNQIVQDCTHDLLTDTNLLKMQNEGELVDSWEMIAPDHWKFKLKENVKFHDGTILDVDDVMFTFERGAEKSTTSAYVAKIKEFIKVDDLNFEVILHNGDVDFNYVFAANSLAILSKEAFETMPEEEAVKIGTGPWKFEEFVPGDYVSLVRFEECTLYDVPNTERLVFRMIPEASSRMIALENGEVDAIMSPSPTDYNRLSESSNLKLITETGRGQHFIGFNCANTDSIVSNPEFRKAIAYAINKEEMVLAAWDGYAQVSTSIMCRDMEYYSDIEGIPYDPEKAENMFKELNAEGITLNLITSDASHRVKMAENFQAQMAKYGITVNVEFMQQAALIERLSTDKSTEAFVLSWTPGMNADYMYRNPIHSQGGRSFYSNINDLEIDTLIDAAAAEVDTAKRAEMYEELQVRLTTEIVPWVPVAQATLTMGADKDVTGLLLHPGLVHQFKTAEKIIN